MSDAERLFETDDDALSFTQRYRLRLLEKVAPGGVMPDDPKAQVQVAQILNDMDHQALSKKRIKTVDKLGDDAAKAAAFVLAISTKMGNIDFAEVKGRVGGPPRHGEKLIEDISTVPDELSTGIQNITLGDIMKDDSVLH